MQQVERRSNLSLQEFREKYEIPNKPVIITDIVKNWPAYKNWNIPDLLKRFKKYVIFKFSNILKNIK